MPRMQMFEISPNDKIRSRERPLIVWLSTYKPVSQQTHETGKRENLSRTSFSLRIPVELDDDDLDILRITILDCTFLVKSCECIHILHYEKASVRNIFTCPSSLNGCHASSIWYLLESHVEMALWLDQSWIIPSLFIMMMPWRYT
jgi:hypothetical protein